jgi:hypothetical protein
LLVSDDLISDDLISEDLISEEMSGLAPERDGTVMLSDRRVSSARFSDRAIGQINGNVTATRRRDDSNLLLV